MEPTTILYASIFYVLAPITGLAYFALVTLIKKVTKIQYFHGFLLPLVLLVFFVGMFIYALLTDRMGFLRIGFFLSSLWVGVFTLTYRVAWVLVSRKRNVNS